MILLINLTFIGGQLAKTAGRLWMWHSAYPTKNWKNSLLPKLRITIWSAWKGIGRLVGSGQVSTMRCRLIRSKHWLILWMLLSRKTDKFMWYIQFNKPPYCAAYFFCTWTLWLTTKAQIFNIKFLLRIFFSLGCQFLQFSEINLIIPDTLGFEWFNFTFSQVNNLWSDAK